MDATETLILVLLFVVHWAIMLACVTYWWWGRAAWDAYFVAVFAGMAASWFIFDGCIVSKTEQVILDRTADTHIDHPSLQLYTQPGFWFLGLNSLGTVVTVVTLGLILARHGAPTPAIVALVAALSAFFARAKYRAFFLIRTDLERRRMRSATDP